MDQPRGSRNRTNWSLSTSVGLNVTYLPSRMDNVLLNTKRKISKDFLRENESKLVLDKRVLYRFRVNIIICEL